MITIDTLKQELARVAVIQDSTERVKSYRSLLGMAIDYIFAKANVHKPERASMLELVDSDVVANYVQDSDIINSLHYVRILGMNAEHGQKIKKSADKLALDNITYFIGLIDSRESDGILACCTKPPLYKLF